ncbi:DUF5666 domain-containing protein [Verrucosispora sp. WMMD573]|uniref:DUF5666 domain-containing protein n=1 Tax=Verrucosispora sp. WMMD573 TaxID=3015149 RepID=UPI00248AB8D1|nr:DUF5666 domain-containing protein [Verrucosispora sp. WMMD573]WBB54676.1 DUF5666 domain-containing protein [Verrucosispora sp. WMMD573]
MTTDLDTALAVGPRPWRNRATPWLAAALLLVGGFAGGAQAQQAYGPDSGPAPAGRGTAVDGSAGGARGGGARGGGAAPPAATATPATTGTVTDIDTDTMTIRRESGEVITVQTDDRTQIRLPGALEDLRTGDTVVVTGNTQSDEITAATVTRQN